MQAKAARMLAWAPRESPAASVNSAPVPGVATMTNDVTRKARLMLVDGTCSEESQTGVVLEPRSRSDDSRSGSGLLFAEHVEQRCGVKVAATHGYDDALAL